jgi:uncharacterized membrane protein
MDPLGTALFLPGIICLLLALSWGGVQYPWKSGRIIALFVIAFILLTGFILAQIWEGDSATLPPRVMKNRNVFGSAIFIFCMCGSLFVLLIYVSSLFLDTSHTHILTRGNRYQYGFKPSKESAQ